MSSLSRSVEWLFGGPRVSGREEVRLGSWRSLAPADLTRAHARSRYVVVDVETTGLDLKRDKLIAIGAVGVAQRRLPLHDAFATVLRQAHASADANILIHGIGGQAQLAGQDAAHALLDFLEFAGRVPLVAFRAEFDRTMLERAIRDVLGVPLPLVWLDLAFLLPALFRDTRCGSLDEWIAHFGIGPMERHDAVADAFATAELLLVSLAAADDIGMRTPADLIAMQKAQRWLGKR